MSAEALVRSVTGLLEAGAGSGLLASSVLRPSGRLRRTMRRPLWTDGDEGAPCPTAPGDLDHGINAVVDLDASDEFARPVIQVVSVGAPEAGWAP